MNIILLRSSDHWTGESRVLISDQRAEHIKQVLRSAVGDSLRVGQLGGCQGQGLITAISSAGVELEVQLDQPPPPRHRFDVVLALPRPKVLRRIFRTVAEFGVGQLHLINAARVEKSYWQSPLLAPAKVAAALQAGLERSRDTIAPQVHQHRRFRPFIEDELSALCGSRPCWIADMAAPRALSAMVPQPAVVMIGPEGGFVPFELQLAQSVLAQPVQLGPRTLSVDTALTTALAQGLAGAAIEAPPW